MRVNLPLLDEALDQCLSAALDPSLWQKVLNGIMQATGAHGVTITPFIGRSPGIPFNESATEAIDEYFRDGWYHRDYRERMLPSLMKNSVVIDAQFFIEDDYKNEFFKFTRKHGCQWGALVGYGVDESRFACALHRKYDDDAFSFEESRALKLMVDRLTLATSISFTVADANMQGQSEAYDRIGKPCVFFDRHGRVLRINVAAEALFKEDLQLSNGEIKVPFREEGRLLNERIQSVIGSRLLSSNNPFESIRISRHGKRPLVFRVQRLRGYLPDLFSRAYAIALIDDLSSTPDPSAEIIQKTFDLTPTEAAIAILLSEGLGPREISEQRNITYETARHYVKVVMGKLAVSRQSEVAVLLSRLR